MSSGGRPRRLRVGLLEATWERGGLRWITVDGTEILRGIQLTARDADWRTLTPAITELRIDADAEAFSITFDARWRGEEFAADGRVRMEGGSQGRIEARLSARVGSPTVAQRLGLVVLHPATAAGRPFEASGDRGEVRGVFPELVSADRFASEIRSLRWEPSDGLRASLRFDGEPWETEDQRAWTDASFKSYSPPLSRPHPVTLPTDSVIDTAVRLDVTRTGGPQGSIPSRRRPAPRRVQVRDASVASLPPIGFSWSGPLGTDEAQRLRSLRPAHLRVVVDHIEADWRMELRRASRDAAATTTALQLELVGFADEDARRELSQEVAALDAPLAGALAFGSAGDAGLVTSEASAIDALRGRLGAHVPGIVIGGGSRAGYAELAAADVPFGSIDTVAFSVTPQIHATDVATIVENLATLPTLVRSGGVLGGGRPLDVLCSFRPRFDAYADPPERGPAPSRFDDRLAGGLGSAWLVGTLAGVLAEPTGRVTTLEASGRAGVLASGGLFAILQAILSMSAGRVLRVDATGACTALAVRSENHVRVITANLGDRAAIVRLDLPAGWHAVGNPPRRLDLAPFGYQILDVDPA